MANSEKQLNIKRGVLKRRITNIFSQIDSCDDGDVVVFCELIEKHLKEVQDLDNQINDVLLGSEEVECEFSDEVAQKLDCQTEYLMSVQARLKIYRSRHVPQPIKPQVSDCKLRLPELNCETFNGEGSSQLQYHSFKSTFNNVIGLRENLSDATKLNYLKSYLKGYAAKLVQHLQITDSNYSVAIELLDLEFLNIEALCDEIIKKFLYLKPKSDPNYLGTKLYLNEIRCLISDLKSYDYDFLGSRACSALASHIVFQKLCPSFRMELVRKLGKCFPSLNEIFENYGEIIRALNLKGTFEKTEKIQINENLKVPKTVSFVNNSLISNKRDFPKFCKFCSCNNHNMVNCQKYSTALKRRDRCKELGLCANCSSSKHATKDCKQKLDFPCLNCKATTHITALCSKIPLVNTASNVCINKTIGGKTYILPAISLSIGTGKSKILVKCLIDTGSQRSYLSDSVLRRLNFDKYFNEAELVVSTFLDSKLKNFKEIGLNIKSQENAPEYVVPFYIGDVNISYSVEGLFDAFQNIKSKLNLSCEVSNDTMVLEGIIGVDCIQLLGEY